MNLTVFPSAPLQGTLTLPGDKSISHRAVILGSIAQGNTIIKNLLESEDVLCTVKIFQQLGVDIKRIKQGSRIFWRIKGQGLAALKPPRGVLYCGNSGTTMRLLMGLLAGLPFRSVLTGDDSLNRRPMGRVADPLRKMGADITEVIRGKKRLIVIQGKKLKGIHYRSPVASAQVKSAILLAGLTTRAAVSVSEPVLSRDHTERMLAGFGVGPMALGVRSRGLGVSLGRRRSLKGRRLVVPGDPSSAAFFVVAGLISPHRTTHIYLKKVNLNPTRSGFLTVLQKMGGRVKINNRRVLCGEPVGDLEVSASSLRRVRVGGKIIPSLIDEVPVLAVAASRARGVTHFNDVAELRVKETDRSATLEKNFRRLGIRFVSGKESFKIEGMEKEIPPRPPLKKWGWGDLQSYNDHRIAMSLAILGTAFPVPLLIKDVACINTSFPQFFAFLRKIGGKFKIYKRNFRNFL